MDSPDQTRSAIYAPPQAQDIKSYDQGHDHMMMFADTLSDGIAKQFPEKLKG
jgi:hypothetical protein